MLVLDTNVLIYAVHERSAQHSEARAWLTGTLAGSEIVGIPWQSALGFVRITTNPRVFSKPLPVEEALGAVRSWLAHPRVTVPEPTRRHLDILAGLLETAGTAGNLTADAHLAALALEHGGAVASFDRDLARFGVRVVVPTP